MDSFKKNSLFVSGMAFLGVSIFLTKTTNLLYRLYPLFLKKPNLFNKYKKSWVVVTGASDGIGLQFIKEFSHMGFDCVLIARNKQKLNNTIEGLQKSYPNVKYKIIVADFTESLKENFFENIEKELEKLNISILINNVGMSNMNKFVNVEKQEIFNEISVNCTSSLILSNFFLKKIKNQLDNCSFGIINIGSFVGKHPFPYISTYSGCKSFVNNFSYSLSQENKSSNLQIFCLAPYFVQTKMTAYRKLDFETVSIEKCVGSALKQFANGKQFSYGAWQHEIIGWAAENLPFHQFIFKDQIDKFQKICERFEKLKNRNKNKNSNN